jgi:outer membrane protein OmpA-like peptidoglycan-associated protein
MSLIAYLVSWAYIFGAKPVWMEDFTDNHRGWLEISDTSIGMKIENGVYRLSSLGVHGLTTLDVRDFSRSFRLEVNFSNKRRERGAIFGILWAYKDKDNYSAIEFIDNQASVFEIVSGIKHELCHSIPFNPVGNTRISIDYNQCFTIRFHCATSRNKSVRTFPKGNGVVGGTGLGFYISGTCDIRVNSIALYAKPLPNIITGCENKPEKKRLPETINSKYSEISPIVSPDGNVLYFTVHGSPDNMGYEKNKSDQDIYCSFNLNGKWTEKMRIPAPVNSIYSNAVCGVLTDNSSLLLGGIYPHYNGLGPLIATKSADKWNIPKPLSIPGFYNDDKQYGFGISPDGKAVVMSLKRKEGLGKRDFYVSLMDDNGKWSEPKWMGTTINTPKTETEPFIAADGQTMYFASDGRKGYGKCDIYVTRRLDDSWTKWSEPFNLGPNFNTKKDEFGISVDALSGTAYFSSSHNSLGGTDIFQVQIPSFSKPKPMLLLTGDIDSEAKTSIYVYDRERKNVMGRYLADDGKYKVILPAGNVYYLEWISDIGEVFIDYYDTRNVLESRCDVMNINFYDKQLTDEYVEIKIVASENTERLIRANVVAHVWSDSVEGTFRIQYYDGELSVSARARLPVRIPVPTPSSTPHLICLDPVVVPQSFYLKVGSDISESIRSFSSGKLVFSGSVRFDFGKFELNHQSRDTMDKFCKFLTTRCHDCSVLIVGHTDDLGDAKYNHNLSFRRAETIRTFIIQRVDWPEDMIFTQAYGEMRPLLKSKSKEARRNNRRVELMLYRVG